MFGVEESLCLADVDVAGRVIDVLHGAEDELQRTALGAQNEVNAREVFVFIFLNLIVQVQQQRDQSYAESEEDQRERQVERLVDEVFPA